MHWVVNHYIKSLYIFRIVDKKKIKYQPIQFSDFTKGLRDFKDILNIEWVKTPTNLEDEQNIHHYYRDLAYSLNKLKLNKSKIFENLWDRDESDLEVKNNYQRFHLFAEIGKTIGINASAIFSLISNWIIFFRPRKNIAWNSFNCSVRLINWMKMFSLIADDFQVDSDEWRKIQKSVFKQTYFISKSIEKHIPGNHVLIQYYSLWLISILFPEWEKSLILLRKIDKLFEGELNREFLNEGFHFEQSYHYHLQSLLFGLHWLKFNHFHSSFVSDETKLKLYKAFLCAKEMIVAGNYMPMRGDNCFNFINISLREDYNDIEKLGDDIFQDIDKNFGSVIKRIDNLFIKANYKKSEILFYIGNVGLKNNPGHGHSDLLSFIYVHDNHPVFIDPGTKRYSNNKNDLLLKTASSHNTISINNESQAKLWGFFRWAFLPNKINSSIDNANRKITLQGEYVGFKSLGYCKHKRNLILDDNDLIIEDFVECENPANIALNFILHPSIKIFTEKNEIYLLTDKFRLVFDIDANSDYRLDILPFKIYPSYDVGIPSNKILVKFEKVFSHLFVRFSIRKSLNFKYEK